MRLLRLRGAHGTARRPGRRPRGLVGERLLPAGNEAVREIVAAFEQKTGNQVELVHPPPDESSDKSKRRLRPGSRRTSCSAPSVPQMARWAYDDRLVDLSDAIGPVLDLFDADAIEVVNFADGKTGRTRSVRPADGPSLQPRPCLEQPAGARRLHPCRHPERVGGVLVVLVRPGAAGRAQGSGPGRHLGSRAVDVGRLRTPRSSYCSSSSPMSTTWLTRDGRSSGRRSRRSGRA